MPDVVGVTGLAIAVFDKIWLIGSKTAEIISDYRQFDKDSVDLANDIICENHRTKTLRCLLFESSKAYDGKCLFEQFDEIVQIQIQVRLEKLLNIINEGSELLQRQLEEDTANSGQATNRHEEISPARLTPMGPLPLVRKKSRTLRLRWSLWDKRRLESIIKCFAKENEKVNSQVELLCHATTVGVTLKNLERLKTNEHSKKLGFHLPAQLHLNTTGIQTSTDSLQWKDESLSRSLELCSKHESGLVMLEYSKSHLLVEFRSYAPEKTEPVILDGQKKARVELLAHLLCQQKDVLFRTLSCKGWMLQPHDNQVAFLFSIPEGVEGNPYSLLRILGTKDFRPSLGERLRLAKGLANSICELQLVKWVHESFRSDNVLFFPRLPKPNETSKPVERIEVSRPWVMGFEFSRPELHFSSGRSDKDISRNIYRHPERQNQPQKPFSKIHDIYSLGVVLLEIGLWRPVLSLTTDGFKRVNDPRTIKDYLVNKAKRSLPREVGEHYKNVVIRCLTGEFDIDEDNSEDLKLQEEFREQVLDVLDRAAESIG